jgi:prepilin-type N-terminal cleavage/methylation domain-containing protein
MRTAAVPPAPTFGYGTRSTLDRLAPVSLHRKPEDATIALTVPSAPTFARGFTLTEMAVVLVIMALLIGGMLMPLAAQDGIRRTGETQATLKGAIEALLGFAAANGRLPCPATGASNGIEAPAGGGICTLLDAGDTAPVGFLPGATLGLAPLDSQGRVLDAWGNPLRYATTTAYGSAFTTANGVQGIGMANVAADQLVVCPSAAGGVQNAGTANADCPAGITAYARNAVAVVYSIGKNAGNGGTGTDEQHNPNPNMPSATLAADRLFVSHDPTPAGAANGEFDDIVLWLSPNVLYNRMIAAGRLP